VVLLWWEILINNKQEGETLLFESGKDKAKRSMQGSVSILPVKREACSNGLGRRTLFDGLRCRQ